MPRRKGEWVTPPVERFLAKFEIGDAESCWVWRAGTFKAGYGQFNAGDGNLRAYYAHRYSYEHFVGPIPDGAFVCHTCDNPPCVNPAHLFIGTSADNHRDMMQKGRFISGFSIRFGKITDEQVREIRRVYVRGDVKALAARYGVWPAAIYRIVNGSRRGRVA